MKEGFANSFGHGDFLERVHCERIHSIVRAMGVAGGGREGDSEGVRVVGGRRADEGRGLSLWRCGLLLLAAGCCGWGKEFVRAGGLMDTTTGSLEVLCW